MKKTIAVLMALITIFVCFASFTTYAADDDNDIIIIDEPFTDEYFESLEHVYAEYIEPRVSGLIISKSFGIAKDGTYIALKGVTECISEVVRCGFSKIVIERTPTGSSNWVTYATFNDLCVDSNKYSLSKKISVDKGYQYRATATHYARKSLLSTQKITASSVTLTF